MPLWKQHISKRGFPKHDTQGKKASNTPLQGAFDSETHNVIPRVHAFIICEERSIRKLNAALIAKVGEKCEKSLRVVLFQEISAKKDMFNISSNNTTPGKQAHDNTWKKLKGFSLHQRKNVLVIWFVVDQRLAECILDGVCSQLYSFIMLDIGPSGKSTRK